MMPGIIHVVLVDFGGGRAAGISRVEQMRAAAALTIQAQQHFALPPPYGYGLGAVVRSAVSAFDVHPDEWVIGLFQHADQPGALGYHDEAPNGKPFAKLFPLLDKQDGHAWTITASHELLEMLADPNIARCAQAPDGTIWAYEVADQVEAQSYPIHVDGVDVLVSDFCTPANFEPPSNWQASKLKLNWLGNLTAPMQVLPGGYAQYFDPQAGWQMIQHAAVKPRAYRQTMLAEKRGRSVRRMATHPVAAGGQKSA